MKDDNTMDMSTLINEWGTSKKYREQFTNDFPALDNLVDGIPINHSEGAPYVADTTLPGLVRHIPRASLQQVPVFGAVVNGTKHNIPAQICSYILRRGVFNEDTFGKGLLSTMQIGGEQALTHGYAPFMTATGKMYDNFGTTMRLLHYDDVCIEPGVSDANESGYFYVEAGLTKTRVQKILRSAKNNPDTQWNVEALEMLLESEPAGRDYTPGESDARNRGVFTHSSTYQFITRYEVGVGGKFITFCPQAEDAPLRVIENKSKFGYPRVQFLVIDPAPLVPFGTSRVRIASPNQNLMNVYYQNVASMLILNSKPALLVRGKFANPVQLKQGAVWEAIDQNSNVELKEMGNGTLQQFVQVQGQMSSQIQNIMGSPSGTVAGGDNSMGFSKTAPGVKMQQDYQSLSTNQITHIMENFLRQYALVALDTYIAEQTGEESLLLDEEAKNAINRIAPDTVGEDNRIDINWEEFYEGIEDWQIDIELSMGKDELDEKKRGDLQDTLTVLAQNAEILGPEAQERVREITDMLLERSVPESKRLSNIPPQPPQDMDMGGEAGPIDPAMLQ